MSEELLTLGGEAVANESAGPAATDTSDTSGTAAPAVNPATTTLAAALATAAAAWMCGGVFRDFNAHFVALAGVLVGGGLVYISYRARWAANLQYAAIPLSALLGAVLVAPDARGSAGILVQVKNAVTAGGLLQPPISFDPGWRFVLVVMFALVAAGTASLGVALGRPKLAVGLTLPLTMGAALVQPLHQEISTVAVSLVLAVVGITLAFGAELGSEGQLEAGFETRRLLRGAGIAAAMAVAVVVLSNFSFLFPQPATQHVIPPQKPPVPPPQPDQVLFSYTSSRPVELRLGVIDIYDPAQKSWLLPPVDNSRLQRVTPSANIPGASYNPKAAGTAVKIKVGTLSGHALPDVAGLRRVEGGPQVIAYDPRTNGISLADRPDYPGFTYTVKGAPIPTGQDLAAERAAAKSMSDYLVAPTPPPQVTALLQKYSQRAAELKTPENPFDRVMFVRNALYQNVVAAGPGNPGEMTSKRVADMLGGGEANPFEIVAAEALLARWAGTPSRIGYGYYGGDQQADGSFAIHPRNGSMWLEAYFPKDGWVPLVGVPPKAKASFTPHPKTNLMVAAVNQLQLIVYIPVHQPKSTQLFVYLWWYLERTLPVVAAFALLLIGYPWPLKVLRSRQRRRWGREHGLEGRIAAAYCDFRDRCRDLTIGDPSATPVRFLDYIAEDDQHQELAWLVTRALWGDLRRDLREEDAEAAERLARSLSRRVDRAQPGLNRLLARIARTSPRAPFEPALPNPWFELSVSLGLRERLHAWRARRRRAALLRRRRVMRPIAVGLGALLMFVLVACGPGSHVAAVSPRKLPKDLVPSSLGPERLQEEKGAEHQYRTAPAEAEVSQGLVYTLRRGSATDGALEVALFKPDVDVSDINDESKQQYCADNPDECHGHDVFMGIQSSLGGGHFRRIYYKQQRAYFMKLPDQTIYLWFPPRTQTMAMLILTGPVAAQAGTPLLDALLDFQNHRQPGQVAVPDVVVPASPQPQQGPPVVLPSASPAPLPAPSSLFSPAPGGSPSP